jgi:hypothetical protein
MPARIETSSLRENFRPAPRKLHRLLTPPRFAASGHRAADPFGQLEITQQLAGCLSFASVRCARELRDERGRQENHLRAGFGGSSRMKAQETSAVWPLS